MKYDVTVIGSGPGGYVAAIRCAQLGMKTAIIEKTSLGGTCLNVGCIPSKALLDSSEHYYNATKTFKEHGIDVENVKVNFPQMIKRKGEVIDQTVGGIEFLMKKNKIDVHKGFGSFVTKNTIKVTKEDGTSSTIETDKTIIATGSEATVFDTFNYDGDRIITSTEALELPAVPETMTIIGGGVIGLELGSVYARLGTKVEVVEFADRIIAGMDGDCSKELMRAMKKHLKVKFHLKYGVTSVTSDGKKTTLTAKHRTKDTEIKIDADYCLIAVGRKAYTDKLGLENLGIPTDKRGRIEVNAHLETNVKGVFAIGDVIKGAMLAHKAEEEGVFVAEYMNGEKPHINYNLIPGVVYTWPEVAAVGQTEEQLKASGRAYKVGKFPMRALGRARASMDIDGMVKVLADEATDEVLGVHMVGPRTADMIAEAVIAMEFRASAEDIARASHAHPTYTEATKEAALAATGNRALHI